jgi:hypothetical protein
MQIIKKLVKLGEPRGLNQITVLANIKEYLSKNVGVCLSDNLDMTIKNAFFTLNPNGAKRNELFALDNYSNEYKCDIIKNIFDLKNDMRCRNLFYGKGWILAQYTNPYIEYKYTAIEIHNDEKAMMFMLAMGEDLNVFGESS